MGIVYMDKQTYKEELAGFEQEYMDSCFDDTCQYIKKETDTHGRQIWEELRETLYRLLPRVKAAQAENKKGDAGYLLFSFMWYCAAIGKLEYQADILDDSYYLDRYETTEYYCPAFLQDRYREDLNYLKGKAERTLVRVQQFQVMEIQEIYTRWYNAIVFRLLEGMAEMAMEEIMESGIRITDRFQILYGDYMGKTVILYEKGREE